MSVFANAFRRAAGALALRYFAAGVLLLSSHPAFALYAEVKPTLKVGVDCIESVSVLAPKLATCSIAGTKMRIWCPNGQMFEGTVEHGGPHPSLARSLCNMSQVP
jgi:hypothetical protein